MSADEEPQGAAVAAEIACGKEDWDAAENAAMELLSRIRFRQRNGGNNE